MLSADRSGLDPQSATAKRWKTLADEGVMITVLIPHHDVREWSEGGLRVVSCGGGNRLARYINCYRAGRLLEIDCITAQDPLELGWLAYALSLTKGKPFEIQDHGGFYDGGEIFEPYWKWRSVGIWYLARRARSIRTVSPASAKLLQQKGYSHVRLAPIPANQEFAQIQRKPERGLIVAVGRLVKVKQFDRLLRAFKRSFEQGVATRLEIMGDGPERAYLEAYAVSLGISEHVIFHGNADPRPLLERASVFALFSKHEGWGVAWVEAALARVPVVMTPTGCADWLVSQHCAVVSEKEEDDADAIELAMTLPMPRLSGELVPTIEESAKAQRIAWKQSLKPRLLVVMQAVDADDLLIAVFVEWLRKAERVFGALRVLALRVGRHSLPKSIPVVEMRPRQSTSKIRAFFTMLSVSWKDRYRYDGVFLRGDAIYAVIMGWFWRLLGKSVVLWYAHYKPNRLLPFAERFVTAIVSSVPEAYPGRPTKNVYFLGQGIDAERFTPSTPTLSRSDETRTRLLVVGRVQPIKGTKQIIEEFIQEGGYGRRATLTIAGPVLDESYEKEIDTLIAGRDDIRWLKGVPYDDMPALLKEHDLLLNAYPGSLDKVIVEAMMSGLIPVVATKGLSHTLPKELRWLIAETSEERRKAVRKLLALEQEERTRYAQLMRELALRDHSIQGQIERLLPLFTL